MNVLIKIVFVGIINTMDNETEAADFLDRLDIDVNDFVTKSEFTTKLVDIFARGGRPVPTSRQVNALFDIGETKFLQFPQNNIRRIEFTRAGKIQTRFVLPLTRGLFSFASALKFLGR